MSMVAELKLRIGLAERRCKPFCARKNWVDGPPVANRIRTCCGVCGTFIGYRPVDTKGNTRELKAEDTADVLCCPVCSGDAIATEDGNYRCVACGGAFVAGLQITVEAEV